MQLGCTEDDKTEQRVFGLHAVKRHEIQNAVSGVATIQLAHLVRWNRLSLQYCVVMLYT